MVRKAGELQRLFVTMLGRTSGCDPSAQLAGNGWRLFLNRRSFQCYFASKTQISNLIPQGWTKLNTVHLVSGVTGITKLNSFFRVNGLQ